MADRNEYFSAEIERLGDDDLLPTLQFFVRGKSPIAEADGQRKQVLVFEDGVNFNDKIEGSDESHQCSKLTKRAYLDALTAQAITSITIRG